MTDFDLDKFLKNYKPKEAVNYLEKYCQHRKLKNYKLLNDLTKLKKAKTYIRYVEKNVAENEYDSKNIKVGGVFLAGGTFKERKFVACEDPGDWKVLLKINI